MIGLKGFLVFFVLSSTALGAKIKECYRKIYNKSENHSYGPIDFVYLINLDYRIEKLDQSIKELEPWGISPFRFSAINGWEIRHSDLGKIGMTFKEGMRQGAMGSTYVWDKADNTEHVSHELMGKPGTTYFVHSLSRGAIGCLLSHASILQDALDANYELIWVMEDDVEVVGNPALLLTYIDELDSIVGRDGWDLLYTDRDFRDHNGNYVVSVGIDHRPDVETRNQQDYCINKTISDNLREIGSRFSTTSIIWTRKGLQKYLNYLETHGMFLPIDMDIWLAPGIQVYTVTDDVVTNRLKTLSDNRRNVNQIPPKF